MRRKVSGGTCYIARLQDKTNLLRVIQTYHFQGRSMMDFFTQVLMTSNGVIDRPSLVPQFDT
jgi:transposase